MADSKQPKKAQEYYEGDAATSRFADAMKKIVAVPKARISALEKGEKTAILSAYSPKRKS